MPIETIEQRAERIAEAVEEKIRNGDKGGGAVDELKANGQLDAPPSPPRPAPRQRSIAEIRIAGVRAFGAEEQVLPVGRQLTIVYGANGHGKTSVIDALELFKDGATSRALMGGTPSEVSGGERHRGLTDAERMRVTLCLRTHPATEMTQTAWTEGDETPNSPAPYVVISRRHLRADLLAQPGDRRERFDRVLGIEPDTAPLRLAASQVRARGRTAEETADQATGDLGRIAQDWPTWRDDVGKARSAEKVTAIVEQRAVTVAQVETLAELTAMLDGTENVPGGGVFDAQFGAASRRGVPVADTPERLVGPSPSPDPAEVNAAWEAIETLVDSGRAGRLASAMAELLAVANRTIDQSALPMPCPLCDDGSLTGDRMQQIDQILEANAEDTQREQEHANARATFARLIDAVATATQWTPPAPRRRPSDLTSELAPEAVAWEAAHQAVVDAAAPWAATAASVVTAVAEARSNASADAVKRLCTELAERQRVGSAVNRAIERANAAVGAAVSAARLQELPERFQIASRVLGLAAALRDWWTGMRAAKTLKRELEAAATQLSEVVEGRTNVAYAGIDAETQQWLTVLQPAGTPRISLVVGTSGATKTLALRAHIGGDISSALSTLSDSQLDMLGLAVCLAVTDRDHPTAAIVLDDPADLLDRTSRRRLVGEGIPAILDGSGGRSARQVIVLSHCSEFVKDLWAAHCERWREIVAIDLNPGVAVEVGGVASASIGQRDFSAYQTKAAELLVGEGRLPAADLARVGNLLRSATEAACRDIAATGYRLDGKPVLPLWSARMTLGTLAPEARPYLSEAGTTRALKTIDFALTCLLNDASHASPVVPAESELRNLCRDLAAVASLLGPPQESYTGTAATTLESILEARRRGS